MMGSSSNYIYPGQDVASPGNNPTASVIRLAVAPDRLIEYSPTLDLFGKGCSSIASRFTGVSKMVRLMHDRELDSRRRGLSTAIPDKTHGLPVRGLRSE